MLESVGAIALDDFRIRVVAQARRLRDGDRSITRYGMLTIKTFLQVEVTPFHHRTSSQRCINVHAGQERRAVVETMWHDRDVIRVREREYFTQLGYSTHLG